MWQNLVVNLSVISGAILIWQLVADRFVSLSSRQSELTTGVVLGLAGCLSMAVAEPLIPGFIFDMRGAMVSCAAYFGGPIGAVAAVILTGGWRMQLGGGGVAAGVLSIVSVALAALVFRAVHGSRPPGPRSLAALSLVVAFAYCAGYVLVPKESFLAIVKLSVVPLTTLTFATTWLLAMLIRREMHRVELIRTNNIYRQMVELLPDALNAKDTDGRFIAVNPATARLHGVKEPDDLLGTSDRDFYDGSDAYEFARVERAAIESGKVQTVEQEINISGRTTWVATQKVPITGPQGEVLGVITHNRDITHHRQLLKMKNEFVSMVSHELRTPLTSVRGSLGLLTAVLGDEIPNKARGLLAIAQRNSERLVRLINDILDVEKVEGGSLDFDLRPIRVAPLIRDMLPSYSNYMPDLEVSIEFEDRATDAVAVIDPARFEQVLSNLISNAIKFSKSGDVVRIILDRSGGQITISVVDRGLGIPDEFQSRIFSRFEQVDASDSRQRGGTGLGLHIAKVIVEKMDGSVRFVSHQGEGTTFSIDLPDRTARNASSDRDVGIHDAAITQDTGNRPKRILYIEDDASLGEILKGMFSADVFVEHVASLEDGRRAIGSRAYDLLLIDDELPDGSGLTLIDEVDPDTPIVVFTAREVVVPRRANVRHRFVKTRISEKDVVALIYRILDGSLVSLPKAS